jgi:hypothetical protein
MIALLILAVVAAVALVWALRSAGVGQEWRDHDNQWNTRRRR